MKKYARVVIQLITIILVASMEANKKLPKEIKCFQCQAIKTANTDTNTNVNTDADRAKEQQKPAISKK